MSYVSPHLELRHEMSWVVSVMITCRLSPSFRVIPLGYQTHAVIANKDDAIETTQKNTTGF